MNMLFGAAARFARLTAAAALVGVLSACGGGGGNAGDPVLGGGGGGNASVAELSIVLDKSNVPNNGSSSVTATVTALDKNRVAVKNVTISFAADANGVVKPAGTATDDNGELKAVVEIGADKTNRTITLTATSGNVSKTASFTVVDSTTTEPTATALAMQLDKRTVNNSGTDTVTVTVTATGVGGQALAGIPVSFTVDGSANYVQGATTTNGSGVVTATVRIGEDKSNRVVNVTAKSGLLTKTDSFQVTGVKLSSSAVPATLSPGQAGSIEYRVADVNGAPIPKITVNVAAPGLVAASGTTDVNGLYVHRYTAPATVGSLTFTATAAGVSADQAVLVTNGTTTIPPVTTSVAALPVPVTATPNVLKVNTATTTSNQSQIKAQFLGAGNAPVQNMRVRFDFDGATSSAYGTLSAGGNLVYSDAQGYAITNFTAGTAASPTNGVVIRACWDYSDFPAGTCPHSAAAEVGKTSLTVVAEGQAVSIGTDATISEGGTGLTYVKRFVVQVADPAGNPVGSQQITPSIDLLYYGKGSYFWNASASEWQLAKFFTCANEDANRNGALESGEDSNANGMLDPRKADVTVSMEGTGRTDTAGQAVLRIEYPKSHAGWVFVRIQAAADVRSPSAYWNSWVPVDAVAIKAESPPAFHTSPYGAAFSNTCAVAD